MLMDQAVQHHRAGRLKEAEALYRTVLAAEPRNADCLHLLGLIAYKGGQHDKAADLISRALRIKPDDPAYHYNLGNVFRAQERADDAVAEYRRALVLRPDYAEARYNLGGLLRAQGELDEALACFGKVAADRPDHIDAHINMGVVLQELSRLDEAHACFSKVLALKPDSAEAHYNTGSTYGKQEKFDDALVCYERALAIRPDYAEAHNEVATLLIEQGKFDDAQAHFKRALAIRPDYAQAHYNRAGISKFLPGDPHLTALAAVAAANKLPKSEMIYIHFALAKAFEESGDYTRAFGHMRLGNTLKREQIDYNEADSLDFFRRIGAVFDKDLLSRFEGAGDPSPTPVFVLGMPRSGSTLVEQILSSHPQVHGAGELPHLQTVVWDIPDAGRLSYPECVPALDAATFARLGRDYLIKLPAPGGKTRIIDKLPGNFMHIGLIRLILPHAKIIHTVRDPVDTCVSCYSKLFADGVRYSYDLAELGRCYRAYHELMTHWRVVLAPGAMLDVVYEDVVDDIEGQARRLVDYCGLPWDDRCLEFHKNKRPVKTASAAQVRKPLFRSSLQRWRKYEADLGPLLQELGDLVPAPASST